MAERMKADHTPLLTAPQKVVDIKVHAAKTTPCWNGKHARANIDGAVRKSIGNTGYLRQLRQPTQWRSLLGENSGAPKRALGDRFRWPL